jgi:peptidoglycan/xylan/chitin deacetylase (PgdA/CDA1 family)
MLERMPRWLKRALKPTVARLIDLRWRWSNRRMGLALCYHRVGDPEGDVQSEVVPAMGTKRFEAQVRYLRRRYRLVAASGLMDAVVRRRRGERLPVSITFDDDLPSHAGEAMPILRRLGVPATFFLCGASLERPHEFWWERLQRAWDRGLVDEGLLDDLEPTEAHPQQSPIRRVAMAIERLPPGRRDELAEELAARVGPDRPDSGLSARDVASLTDAGFEIGFHTLRHYSLPTLDDGSLARAMTEGKGALEKAVGTAIATIAYPHGDADQTVANAARAAGYRFGFSAYGRAITERADSLLLDRRYPLVGTRGDFALDLARGFSRAGSRPNPGR